ncbi:MAG TPA: TIGR02099 family protein, partial [Ramlibacter sp.]
MERQASRALGVPVRIGAVAAHSQGLVPSIELQAVELLDDQGHAALRLQRVLVAVSLGSLWNRGFDQLFVDAPELDVRRAADGRIYVAGLDLSSGERSEGSGADWFFRQGEFVIRGGTLRWTDEMRNAPELGLTDVDLVVRNGVRSHALRIDATPPPRWGDRFSIMGTFRQPLLSAHPGRWQDWDGQVYADFHRVDLKELRRHTRLGVDIESGHGAVRAWADVAKGQVVGGTADLSVADVVTRLAPDLAPLGLATLSGRLGGKWRADGFEFETRDLQFITDQGQRWPGGKLSVSWREGDGKRLAAGELQADRLDLAALRQLAGRLPLGRPTHTALAAYAPEGLVENVQARWQGELRAPQKYQAKGRVTGLHVAAGAAARRPDGRVAPGSPGIRNAALEFELTEAGGSAKFHMQSGALELPGVFDDPVLPFDRLAGDVQWQLAGERLSVNANNVKFSNADAQGEAQASWRTGDDAAHRYPGVLDLSASLSRANGARVWRYLPLGLPQAVREYVRDG